MRRGLLALLDAADMDGDELTTAYSHWTGDAWAPSVGQVASTLERLESDGLVSAVAVSAPAGPRRYAITRSGRDALAAWFAASTERTELPRDELIAKILLAMAGGRDRAMEVILCQRSSLTTALQARRHDRPRNGRLAPTVSGAPLSSLSPTLLDDAVVARTEAELRWLDLCEARILRTGPEHTSGGQ